MYIYVYIYIYTKLNEWDMEQTSFLLSNITVGIYFVVLFTTWVGVKNKLINVKNLIFSSFNLI